MPTLTSAKRSAFPARYRRKDARTAIYRAVYGPLANNERDGTSCNYQSASAIYQEHWRAASLPLWKALDIEERISILKKGPRMELARS